MSTTVISKGWVAVVTKVPEEYQDDIGEFQEKLWDEGSTLLFNCEETLVYNDTVPYSEKEEFYGLTLGADSDPDLQEFLKEIKRFGIEVDNVTMQPYSEIWYNGADSMISDLSKKEFLDRFYGRNS